MTYSDFIIKLTNTMKVRSTNYRLTQDDITILARNVFDEIAAEVVLDVYQQEVLIDQAINTYDLDALYTQIGHEVLLSVMSIFDDSGYDVGGFFRNKGHNVFVVDKMIFDCTNDAFLEDQKDRYITFNRQFIPTIEEIDSKLQNLVFNAMIEGMMWYTHDSIPNPVSSSSPAQETNAHYQRYSAAKKLLKNNLPQRI